MLQEKTWKNEIWIVLKLLITYKILIIGGFLSGKTNALLYLINHQPDIDKNILWPKDPYEENYDLNKQRSVSSNFCNNPKALLNSHMDDIYKNIDDNSPNKKLQILIVFDDVIA